MGLTRAASFELTRRTAKGRTVVMTRRLIPAISAVFLAVAGISSGQTKPAGGRFALVVGNARYETAVGPLRNAVNDARAVSKTLRGLGFTVIEEHNVNRDGLLEAVADFRKRIKDSEVALFYFAGHGISVAGSNYLMPVKSGYQTTAADELTRRMLAETRLFNAEQVVAEMSAAGARCNLVILDACRTTPAAIDPNARDAASSGGLSAMKPPAGSLIAFATDAGHTALDGEGTNGLYTGELIKHLQTPGITIEQVFKRTRAGVMAQSEGKQLPAEYSRLVGDDIYLAGNKVADPPAPPLPKAEPVKVPTAAEINRLAAAGETGPCLEAMRLATAANGPGEFAAPIDALLEKAKEDLKEFAGPPAAADDIMKSCLASLDAIRDCLPTNHPRHGELTAKARNRLGDCLMLMGKPGEALPAYEEAVSLAPDDAYPLYNRGRAKLALGDATGAKADFEAAAGPRFKQPKARQLAREALGKIP